MGLCPPGKGLTEVTHPLPRPMPQYRFVKFTKELLTRQGSPVAGVEGVCTHWGRRVLPTVANIMRLSSQDVLALGNWQGTPKDMVVDTHHAR